MNTSVKFLTATFAVAALAISPVSADHHGSKSESKPAGYGEKSTKNIVETAQAAGTFNTLIAAATAGGLAGTLTGEGPLTVFAPTDEAFAKLPAGTVESLLLPENKDKLVSILTYHVVAGKLKAGDVVKSSGTATVNGQFLPFSTADGVKAGTANVTATDIKASNGVIHVIDSVLIPTDESIVDVAAANGSFNTLIAAAKAAGLADTLATGGPFTVFAPTDEAFAALPAGTVETLLKPENKGQLADILKLHVVPTRVFSTSVADGVSLDSLNGKLTFAVNYGKPTVNGAGIVATDVNASNGVIHVIDKVILPK